MRFVFILPVGLKSNTMLEYEGHSSLSELNHVARSWRVYARNSLASKSLLAERV